MEVTYALAEQMLLLAGVAKTAAEARVTLEWSISSGAALEKLRAMITAQGGDARVVDEPGRLPQAKFKVALPTPRAGFVQDVDAMGVALAALRLGGRVKAADGVDHAVGFSDLVKVGERVAAGAPLCVIHANDEAGLAAAREMMTRAIVVGDVAGTTPKLIDELDRLSADYFSISASLVAAFSHAVVAAVQLVDDGAELAVQMVELALVGVGRGIFERTRDFGLFGLELGNLLLELADFFGGRFAEAVGGGLFRNGSGDGAAAFGAAALACVGRASVKPAVTAARASLSLGFLEVVVVVAGVGREAAAVHVQHGLRERA